MASVCGLNPKARETVDTLKGAGYRLALATNPLFPAVATESRIRWAGLEPGDFELYTTYENTGYCKPNPAYYRDLLERLDCDAEDCLMVGNDVEEDMAVSYTHLLMAAALSGCSGKKKIPPELDTYLGYLEDLSTFPSAFFYDGESYIGLGGDSFEELNRKTEDFDQGTRTLIRCV